MQFPPPPTSSRLRPGTLGRLIQLSKLWNQNVSRERVYVDAKTPKLADHVHSLWVNRKRKVLSERAVLHLIAGNVIHQIQVEQ